MYGLIRGRAGEGYRETKQGKTKSPRHCLASRASAHFCYQQLSVMVCRLPARQYAVQLLQGVIMDDDAPFAVLSGFDGHLRPELGGNVFL